ncbi:hypothetical protein AAKU55_002025 [Oxalobacteraceae bacterium GrIS 1.11]
MSAYVRLHSGSQFPFFEHVRDSSVDNSPPVTRIKKIKLGFNMAGAPNCR